MRRVVVLTSVVLGCINAAWNESNSLVGCLVPGSAMMSRSCFYMLARNLEFPMSKRGTEFIEPGSKVILLPKRQTIRGLIGVLLIRPSNACRLQWLPGFQKRRLKRILAT